MDDTRRVTEGPFCGLRMPDYTDRLDLDMFDRAVARGDYAEYKRLRTAYGPVKLVDSCEPGGQLPGRGPDCDSACLPGPCASHYPSVEP